MLEVANNLGTLRRKRGYSAIQLAKMVDVSRQTIYAIEAGSYIPNTVVALRLARALGAEMGELFRLPDDDPAPRLVSEKVTLLPGSAIPVPGQAVQLCRVDDRLMASVPSPAPWYFPASDAVVADKPARRGNTKVQVFASGGRSESQLKNRLLIAGCDPGISVLARHVQAYGIEMVLAHRNSSQALKLLKQGAVHVAGTHLKDEASGESNLPEIGRRFSRDSVAVVSFAVWEEGIVTARGNPKQIGGIADLMREDVSMVNREEGAGSRLILDAHLKKLGMDAAAIRGYRRTAAGHLPAAWQVQSGEADCCIATRAAARVFGLGFIPLVTERYDLAMRREHVDMPAMQTLLDTLNRSDFRRELESLGGYDTKAAGQRLL